VQSDPGADTSNASGQQTRSERVLVLLAATVLFAVLIGGFARLGALFGFDEPVVEPPPTLPSAPLNESGVSSVTGSVLPASPSSLAPDPAVPTTLPSTPETSQSEVTSPVPNAAPSALPPRWPVSLPDPGEHRLLAVESDQEDRWLLAVPGNVALAGGRFVAGLEDLDWSVDAVATPRTLTAVGTRKQERVSVTIRPGGDGLPAGWLLLDVVYQPTIPDFETPPSSSVPPEDEVTKRS
jgi:hypothetical protein